MPRMDLGRIPSLALIAIAVAVWIALPGVGLAVTRFWFRASRFLPGASCSEPSRGVRRPLSL